MFRLSSGRTRAVSARRGDDLRPAAYAERIKAGRGTRGQAFLPLAGDAEYWEQRSPPHPSRSRSWKRYGHPPPRWPSPSSRYRQRSEDQGPRHPHRHSHVLAGASSGTVASRPPPSGRALARFGGFGAVALSLFPRSGDAAAASGRRPGRASATSQRAALGRGIRQAARRCTTFNAFYTSPTVIQAMHTAIARLGVPPDATVLEPGCGTGNFLAQATEGMRFIGVELDTTSGRIARALHPGHDIRIENFRDTQLPEGRIDAVIGNVPFADVKLDYRGQRQSLHDFFFAKSLDALKPGGVLALVTTHFTLDKQNASIREYLADKADFQGAIRLPSDAFKREGTAVVTDIIFLRSACPWGRSRTARRPGLAGDSSPLTIEARCGHHDQPLFPPPPGNGAGHLEPQGPALRRRGRLQRPERGTATSPSSSPRPSGGLPEGAIRPGIRDPARPRRARRSPPRRRSGTSPRGVSSSATTGSSARWRAAAPSRSSIAASRSARTAHRAPAGSRP